MALLELIPPLPRAVELIIIFPSSLLLFWGPLLFPILGVILGIVSLCIERKRIGKKGVKMAIFAIVIPVFSLLILPIIYIYFTPGVLDRM